MLNEKNLITKQEAARILGIAVVTFDGYVKKGYFKKIIWSKKKIWFNREDIETFKSAGIDHDQD